MRLAWLGTSSSSAGSYIPSDGSACRTSTPLFGCFVRKLCPWLWPGQSSWHEVLRAHRTHKLLSASAYFLGQFSLRLAWPNCYRSTFGAFGIQCQSLALWAPWRRWLLTLREAQRRAYSSLANLAGFASWPAQLLLPPSLNGNLCSSWFPGILPNPSLSRLRWAIAWSVERTFTTLGCLRRYPPSIFADFRSQRRSSDMCRPAPSLQTELCWEADRTSDSRSVGCCLCRFERLHLQQVKLLWRNFGPIFCRDSESMPNGLLVLLVWNRQDSVLCPHLSASEELDGCSLLLKWAYLDLTMGGELPLHQLHQLLMRECHLHGGWGWLHSTHACR